MTPRVGSGIIKARTIEDKAMNYDIPKYVFQLPDGRIVGAIEFLLAAESVLAKNGFHFAEDIEDLPNE